MWDNSIIVGNDNKGVTANDKDELNLNLEINEHNPKEENKQA